MLTRGEIQWVDVVKVSLGSEPVGHILAHVPVGHILAHVIFFLADICPHQWVRNPTEEKQLQCSFSKTNL